MIQKSLQPSDFVRLARQRIGLETSYWQAEHAFMDKVSFEMSPDEKRQTLFVLLSDKKTKRIRLMDIVEGLEKVHDATNTTIWKRKRVHDLAFCGVHQTARQMIRDYAQKQMYYLGRGEFDIFLDDLGEALNCSLHEVVEFIVAKMIFPLTGREIMEEKVTGLLDKKGVDDDKAFLNAVAVVRFEVVFDMLDSRQKGKVAYRDVLEHLKSHTGGGTSTTTGRSILEQAPRDIMENKETQDDEQFLEFKQFFAMVLKVAGSTSTKQKDKKIVYHEIANAMTLSACNQDTKHNDKVVYSCRLPIDS
mmetsp:Transcript_6677/g.15252  ORF Transcript_6677/g.15252 Transcript_6677/m.15252 type:complete len:304 (+) Transcript_6677:1483-2394(+)